MTTRSSVSTALGTIAACVAILANFQGASEALMEMLPWLRAFLPIGAVGGITGCTIWLGAVAWRQRKPSASVRFRRMEGRITGVRHSLEMGLYDAADAKFLLVDLHQQLGIPLPKSAFGSGGVVDDAALLRFVFALEILARAGDIGEARKLAGQIETARQSNLPKPG